MLPADVQVTIYLYVLDLGVKSVTKMVSMVASTAEARVAELRKLVNKISSRQQSQMNICSMILSTHAHKVNFGDAKKIKTLLD